MTQKLSHESIDRLITESLAIEAEEASKAGALGFMARALTQATMPHSHKEGSEFSRTNGALTLSIMSPSVVGLPYGSIPRLLVSWLTTEAVRTGERKLVLGESMSVFMRSLDLVPTGGKWGTITRLRQQSERLFASSVTAIYKDDLRRAIRGCRVASESVLWWTPKSPGQVGLWESTVTLTQEFFDEVTSCPVPVDMRALKAIKQSPMALDIYCWLTYRMSYLRKPTIIPWPSLQMQFGADYKLTRQFRASFINHLKVIVVVYPEVRVELLEDGLMLLPSRPHVTAKHDKFPAVGSSG